MSRGNDAVRGRPMLSTGGIRAITPRLTIIGGVDMYRGTDPPAFQ